MELILTADSPMEKLFNVQYLENGERYDVGLKGGQVGNHQWAFDWDHVRLTLDDLEPS